MSRTPLLLACLLSICVAGCESTPPEATGETSTSTPSKSPTPARVEGKPGFRTKVDTASMRTLRATIAANPDDADAHRELAQLLRKANRRHEAAEHVETAARLRPDDPQLRLELALAYTSVARLDEAESIYLELLERPEYRPPALHNLGNLEIRRDNLDRAIDYYEQAVELRPDYLLALYHLGMALQQSGRFSEAYQTFARVLRRPPPTEPGKRIAYFDAAYHVSSLEMRRGAYDRAAQVLSDLIENFPQHPSAQFAYGRAMLGLGREEDARRAFERHMQLPDRSMGRTGWLGSPELGQALEKRVSFHDVTGRAGIRYRNVCGAPPGSKNWITETLGAGAAWLDYDGDGVLDLYLVNGSRHGRAADEGEPNQLYRGDGNGSFVDVTDSAGVGHRGWGQGVAVGDVDNDGDADVYVTNYGPNALYRNEGDGTFTDVTDEAGVGDERWGTSAAFFDLEGDGDLDLYVGNYLECDPAKVPKPGESEQCIFKGVEVMCGPKPLAAHEDVLYRNEGDGTFTDVSREAGIRVGAPLYTLGVVTGDYDNDGRTDLYVANDSVQNSLWRNAGNGKLIDAGVETLSAVSAEGRAQAGMGTDFGDYDLDGWLDLVVTNFSHDLSTIYHNVDGMYFTDDSSLVGLSVTGMSLSWGTGFRDFDNDGDLDLFIANGHIYVEMDEFDLGTTYRQANHLFLNDGQGRFYETAGRAGPGLQLKRSFRGAAFADYDDDGDVDILVTAIDDEALLLNNQSPSTDHFLKVRLVGTRSNRDGIGARVVLTVAGRTLVRERKSGGSFLSESDPRLHFGLGPHDLVETLEVRWPSGTVDLLRDVPADRMITITEGNGAAQSSLSR